MKAINVKLIVAFLVFITFATKNIAQTPDAEIIHYNSAFLESGDSVVVSISGFRGNIQWEKSSDNINWVAIPEATNDTLKHIVDESTFFRAAVTDGTCNPHYSETLKISTYALYENVKVTDSLSMTLISNETELSQGIYHYSYEGAEIFNIGDVLIGSSGYGYIRKITSVTVNNTDFIFETSAGNFEDVFSHLDLSDSLKINLTENYSKNKPGQIQVKLKNALPGITLKSDGSGLDLSDTEIFSGEVDGVSLTATITEGKIDFNPIIKRECKYTEENGFEKMLLSAGGELIFECDLELTAQAAISYSNDIDIADIEIGPIMLGPVPAFINFVFTAGFEAGVNVQGTVGSGFTATASLEIGASYDENTDPQWSGIYEKNGSFNRHSINWNASANVNSKVFVEPKIAFKIGGIIGPYLAIDPYLRFDGSIFIPENSWKWELAGGIDALLGFEMEAFGYSLVDYNTTFANWEVIFATDSGGVEPPDAGFTFDKTNITLGESVFFNDTTTNLPNSWLWNFGDGTTSTLQSPKHVYLNPGTYTVSLYVSNNYGSDDVTKENLITVSALNDIDNNSYGIVVIGDQVWMDKNLMATKLNDGTDITYAQFYLTWQSMSSPAYCTNTYASLPDYGAIYNGWAATTGNLCPSGWRVPSFSDWEKLSNYLTVTGSPAGPGDKMKDTTVYWEGDCLINATNESGFTAKPGGGRLTDGGFGGLYYGVGYWSKTEVEYNPGIFYIASIECDYGNLNYFSYNHRLFGFYVRCIKN